MNKQDPGSIGIYVGFHEYGIKQAKHWKNDPKVLTKNRAQKELFCQHNIGVLYRNVLNHSGEFVDL